MDNKSPGAELNQLARILFDSASTLWYSAIVLEVVAGILATILGLLPLTEDAAFLGAAVGSSLLIVAYILRLIFDDQYDTAETMRRQSVLSEALGWRVNKVQMSEWRQKAGQAIRRQLKQVSRATDFYTTQLNVGPQRLAEMTIESAFYSRYSYVKLRQIIWGVLAVAILIAVLMTTVALSSAIPKSVGLIIARVAYSFIPIVLAVDLFGWAIRLGRHISEIRDIEEDLERLCGTADMDVPQVLRLVSEYNCQVVAGIPIHNWLFSRWHDEIRELWSQR